MKQYLPRVIQISTFFLFALLCSTSLATTVKASKTDWSTPFQTNKSSEVFLTADTNKLNFLLERFGELIEDQTTTIDGVNFLQRLYKTIQTPRNKTAVIPIPNKLLINQEIKEYLLNILRQIDQTGNKVFIIKAPYVKGKGIIDIIKYMAHDLHQFSVKQTIANRPELKWDGTNDVMEDSRYYIVNTLTQNEIDFFVKKALQECDNNVNDEEKVKLIFKSISTITILQPFVGSGNDVNNSHILLLQYLLYKNTLKPFTVNTSAEFLFFTPADQLYGLYKNHLQNLDLNHNIVQKINTGSNLAPQAWAFFD